MSITRLSVLAFAMCIFSLASAQDCGGMWQPCCGEGTCTSSATEPLTCAGSQCRPCGGQWQDCCGGEDGTCSGGLICNDAAQCAPCGGRYETCCGGEGGVCDEGMACNNDVQCAPCGGPYEICCLVTAAADDCNVGRCNDRHACLSDKCEPCGGEYNPPCVITTEDCDDGLTQNDDGICVP